MELTPTLGDFLFPGDLLYDGPHRGIVVRRIHSQPGAHARFTHYEIEGDDGTRYRVALVSFDTYQVVRGEMQPSPRRVS